MGVWFVGEILSVFEKYPSGVLDEEAAFRRSVVPEFTAELVELHDVKGGEDHIGLREILLTAEMKAEDKSMATALMLSL